MRQRFAEEYAILLDVGDYSSHAEVTYKCLSLKSVQW